MAPPSVPAALVAQVRSKVLEMVNEHPDEYYPSDIARVKDEGDLLVSRYLTREQLDPLSAIETLNGAMRFAKRQGVLEIKESEFSPELLSLIQFQGKDKNGNRIVYIRYKTAKKILKRNSKNQTALKRLSLYFAKKVEDETKGKATFIIDCRSLAIRDLVKYANKDLAEVGAWLMTNGIRYTPDPLGVMVYYEVPRFFAAIGERVIKLIPDAYSGVIKLARKKDIEKIVAKDDMPDYMGGKLVAGGAGSAADEEDSGDEGNDVNNLEDIERVLESESSKM